MTTRWADVLINRPCRCLQCGKWEDGPKDAGLDYLCEACSELAEKEREHVEDVDSNQDG